MANSLRTQVLLPAKLREEIETARRARGESMAEYLRKAVQERLEKEQKRHVEYRKLAEEVVGAVRESSWKNTDAVKWQKEMRKDR